MCRFLFRTTLFITAVMSPLIVIAKEPSNAQLAESITNQYLSSFSAGETKVQKIAPGGEHLIRLGAKKKREIVLNTMLPKSKQYTSLQETCSPILNSYAWRDLNIFCGSTTAPAYHLMSRINKTETVLGEGVLALMLVTPSSDVQELQKRQNIVKTLLRHKGAFSALKSSLEYYQKEAEERLLSLWTYTDPLYTKEYRNYMEGGFYYKNNAKYNKSAGWLEFNKRFYRDLWDIQSSFFWNEAFHLGIWRISKIINPTDPMIDEEAKGLLIHNCMPYYRTFYQAKVFWDVEKQYNDADSDTIVAYHAARKFLFIDIMYDVVYAIRIYNAINAYTRYSDALRNLALRMADVQTFIHTAKELSETIAATPALEKIYGEKLTPIRTLLARANDGTELGRLVYYLDTLPYSAWAYFSHNAGQLLASHTLFVEHKDELLDAMYALGELDAFLGIATLVNTSKNNQSHHSYNFPKFLSRDTQKKPHVKLDDMWNPFLEPQSAIGNSISMDAEKGIRNVILTGPNAGGKSTFLTGVATSLLLSQTLGIVPAKNVVITPFDKINTYIDTTDDIAAGKSLFMAEVSRAHEHIAMLDKLTPSEFSFTIFDEPFSGTNPTEGAAAEYSILESIAGHTNAMHMVATHYPLIMSLEKKVPTKGFRNYKVYITNKKGEKINYTYKVVPGRSTQAIAIDILEEQGYDTKLLKRAREIMKFPERYSTKF